MTEGNTQLTLHNESIERLTGWLTMFAQVSRAMRMHEQAEKMETIRNTIYAQKAPETNDELSNTEHSQGDTRSGVSS